MEDKGRRKFPEASASPLKNLCATAGIDATERRGDDPVVVVRAHGRVADFWELTRDLYEKDAVRNTFTLSALSAYLSQGGAPYLLLTAWPHGSLAGAMLQISRDDPLRLSGLPQSCVEEVVEAYAAADPGLVAVDGPEAVAEAFAEAWCAKVGAVALPPRHNLLHELGEHSPPTVPGAARLATAEDLDLLVGWTLDYEAEDYGRRGSPETMRRILRSNLRGSDCVFVMWEDGGRPVAFACARRPVAGVSRVGPVFAPEEVRGNGYGIAVAGAATTWALETGKAARVVLFTDETSPRANSIYQKLGYRPVLRFSERRFQAS
jgi:predicted GNAT family acetyltransferase